MTSQYYQLVRHNVVAKTLYNVIHWKDNPGTKGTRIHSVVETMTTDTKDYWWNIIVISEREETLCRVMEISCLGDVKIRLKISEK